VVIPDPPVLGVPGQICVDPARPHRRAANVNVTFSVAAVRRRDPVHAGQRSGARGPAPQQHRAVLHHLDARAGQQRQPAPLHPGAHLAAGLPGSVSQRNVDLRRLRVGSLAELLALKIPFSLGNPEPFPQKLGVQTRLIRLRGPQGSSTPLRRSWRRAARSSTRAARNAGGERGGHIDHRLRPTRSGCG